MAINGQIVDEINGLIASRDSIRTTMVSANVEGVTNTSKLADLATNLANAKYTPTSVTVTNSSQIIPTAGKVCTGNITIPAVNYCYTSLETPTNSEGNNGDIWLVVNP